MSTSTSSGGVPIAFALVTIGGILVYSGFKGGNLLDVFASDVPAQGQVTPSPDAIDAARGVSTGGGAGTTMIDGKPVANWIAKDVLCARRNGWSGTVTDGVRTYAEQEQACIHVCGNKNGCPGTCAAPGTSNHRGTVFPLGAVDVTNPDEFDAALKRGGCGSRLKNHLPNDPVHRSFTGG